MHRFLLILFVMSFATVVSAAVKLPSILSNHAVLQRSEKTQIWGKASPGEKINVQLGELRSEVSADSEGKWKTFFDLRNVGEGPFDLIVEGSNRIVVSDVIVGEVWLFSGQSNMAYTLNRSTGGAEEIARSANKRIRQFNVSYNPIGTPQDECKGSWAVADPSTTSAFTAVGYYFAKDLEKSLNRPVGIIRSAWAGTAIMSWISETSISEEPELKEMNETAKRRVAEYPKLKSDFVSQIFEWEKKHDRADRPSDVAKFAATEVDEKDWQSVALRNTRFKTIGLPDAGAVWLRMRVNLPANAQPVSASLIIGAFDQTYWNGQKIGETTEATSPGPSALRFYKIPPELCKTGENVLAVRVFTPTEGASFGSAYVDAGTNRIQLSGNWLVKSEFEFTPLTDKNYPQLPGAPGMSPAVLYNGMIHPITPFNLAGVVWYQGEQDSGRKEAQYLKMLKTLIGDWRARFGAQLPVIICQLPNNGKKTDNPNLTTWANIREAQRKALEVAGTSLVTTIDVGEEDVHPPDKKPIGQRAALAALASAYGAKVVASGPLIDSLKIDGDRAVLSFKNVGEGLVAKSLPADYLPTYSAKEKVTLPRNSPGSELEGFAICGEDRKWVWAQAKIEGDRVIVSSPKVAKPIAVRYAWSDNPTCNLYNQAGLPASPFQVEK